jgi:hypothetical protein
LVINVNLPNVIETLCSVAIVWANLAYLLVTAPLLLARLRRVAYRTFMAAGSELEIPLLQSDHLDDKGRPYFSLGRWGLPVNAIAVAWGLFVVINISWPRAEIYGSGGWSRFAALLATLGLIAAGTIYFLLFQRRRTGILAEHAAEQLVESESILDDNSALSTRWIGQLAPGE